MAFRSLSETSSLYSDQLAYARDNLTGSLLGLAGFFVCLFLSIFYFFLKGGFIDME